MACSNSDVRAAKEALSPLYALRDEIVARLCGTHYPHYVYWLLDDQRLTHLGKDIESILGNIKTHN
jgi:hypothetical protein